MSTALRHLRARPAESFLVIALFVLALVVRWEGVRESTVDIRIFSSWYHQLLVAGRWRGLDAQIGNYNAPFLYVLVVATYLPGSTALKLKFGFMLFDLLVAFFTYRLVALRRPGTRIPTLAALVVLFLPTVAINASLYGQMDSMWASMALGGAYFLIRGRHWVAVGMCTLAVALKPQGIFILPLLLLAVLAGHLRWYKLLAGPVLYVLLDVPAMLIGRDPIELLTIYEPSRQSHWSSELSANAPSFFTFFPVTTRIHTLQGLGYVFTVVLILGLCYAVVARRVPLTPSIIVTSAALFAIQMPYTMTGMHERYFYLGDILSLMVAFYRPRLWFVPVLVQAASLLSYVPFLFGDAAHGPFVPEMLLSTLMGAALVTLWYTLARDVIAFVPPVAEPVPAPAKEERDLALSRP
jgi:Gpi18-like mannosyltransferase